MLGVLARPFSVEGRTLNVGASIGISVYPSDGARLRRAAAATPTPPMYHAKESGRGTWRFFEPALHARSVERLRLENELRGALASSELVLHWQPVVARAGAWWRAPRRWCAGSIPSAACSCPTTSCRSPRTAA